MYLECDFLSVFLCKYFVFKWIRSEEWYVFNNNFCDNGFIFVYIVDENIFNFSGNFGLLIIDKDFGMGDDYFIVWYKELVGGGRSFYFVLGYFGDVFVEEKVLELLKWGIEWVG